MGEQVLFDQCSELAEAIAEGVAGVGERLAPVGDDLTPRDVALVAQVVEEEQSAAVADVVPSPAKVRLTCLAVRRAANR
jgi:hypothetical protein